jgi:beta-glucosidase
MHETYLWPFANAVRAGTASIMCSYQRTNGSYGCQNSKTRNGLRKNELGFQGFVVRVRLARGARRCGFGRGRPSECDTYPVGRVWLLTIQDMNMPGSMDFSGSEASFFGGNITAAVYVCLAAHAYTS